MTLFPVSIATLVTSLNTPKIDYERFVYGTFVIKEV